ncbi:hypothetical protein [Haloferula rosea]|uniref:Uncharacterized protein n=1 Tax=Haloferula rosea TaxID=490093 RepID=A0A934RI39_9BACT|nr:hypothetical protein [Haloferula rosea]MBK1828705.1 hypothetical protein [Haloferula rosea]
MCLLAVTSITAPLFALPPETYRPELDWLIDGSGFKARVEQGDGSKDVTLTNGLVRREGML